MKKRTALQNRLLACAFAGLALCFLLLMLLGVRQGSPVRVGIPRTARAYGAAMLLQTPSAHYACAVGTSEEALLRALNAGELDAALLSLDGAKQAQDCEVRAVLGYLPLLCLSAEKLSDFEALAGRTITMPPALQGTAAEGMLRAALMRCKVQAEIVFAEAGEIIACTVDELTRYDLPVQLEFRRAFDTAPAGLCLVVRREYLQGAGSNLKALEKALYDSARYAKEKSKKTAAMAYAASLAGSEAEAAYLLPYCGFDYSTGAQMSAALHILP